MASEWGLLISMSAGMCLGIIRYRAEDGRMKTKKVENQKMEDDIYSRISASIVRVGRFVLLASTLFSCSIFEPGLDGGHTDWLGYRKGHFCLAAD